METNHNREVRQGGRGSCSRGSREGYEMGVKVFINECEGIKNKSHFSIGNERRVKFSKGLWYKDLPLKELTLYRISQRWMSGKVV